MTQHLFERYYLSKPGYRGGTVPFHDVCTTNIRGGTEILEIGAGPSNPTTDLLATLGSVTGIDIGNGVLTNRSCSRKIIFDGLKFPFPDGSFDACVSNWVLEHVSDPECHFREVARVLRPGGVYCYRTPNLFHYVILGSQMLPHSLHLKFANRLRGLGSDAHDPYPTFYRANRRPRLKRLQHDSGLRVGSIQLIEPEPSYGRAHAALFYPMMAYERIVNSTALLETFRITIIGHSWKPTKGGTEKAI